MIAFPTFDRRLVILLIGQALAGSGSALAFLVTGFVGLELAPQPELATLPMSTFIIGVALGSPLAPYLMARLGRNAGHRLGLVIAATGSAFCLGALMQADFILYATGTTICGLGTAFQNQIRFTAAEAAPAEQKGIVHSWVLLCGLFAAIIGPALASLGKDLLPTGSFTGSFFLFLLILLLVFLAFLFLPPLPVPHESEHSGRAQAGEVLRRPEFWLGASSGAVSFAVMTLLMAATPLQMTGMEHYSHSDTTSVIQSHIVAMFLPGLFSGALLSMLGERRLMGLGLFLFLACLIPGYIHESYLHYWWSLVLLGVGWNFLFLAGSTVISRSFAGPERFAAQGLNDLVVFGSQTVASLAAGWLLYRVGWQALILFSLPVLAVQTLLVFFLPRGAKTGS